MSNVKRPRRWLWVVGGLVLLLVITGAAIWYMAMSPREIPPSILRIQPRQVKNVEKIIRQLTPPAAENAPVTPSPAPSATASEPSTPGSGPETVHLTQDEINEQLRYEMEKRHAAARGIENVYVILHRERVEVVGQLDGQAFYRSLSPDRQAEFPSLLQRKGTIQAILSPYQDLVGRYWLRIDSVHLGHMPIPVSMVDPLLRKSVRQFDYSPENGFRLPKAIRSIQVDPDALTLVLSR